MIIDLREFCSAMTRLLGLMLPLAALMLPLAALVDRSCTLMRSVSFGHDPFKIPEIRFCLRPFRKRADVRRCVRYDWRVAAPVAMGIASGNEAAPIQLRPEIARVRVHDDLARIFPCAEAASHERVETADRVYGFLMAATALGRPYDHQDLAADHHHPDRGRLAYRPF
ncbi:MAG: hypothetical protein WDO69_15420 [Pseudomonadota bacterium]